VAVGYTGTGVEVIGLENLEHMLDRMWSDQLVVQTMEAACFPDGRDGFSDTENAVLGLDGAENWEEHEDPARAFRLVRNKIQNMRQKDGQWEFLVWFDDWPEDAGLQNE